MAANSSTGVVIRFDNLKGFGFIKPDSSKDDEEDLFVHQSAIQSDGYRSLRARQPVRFSVSGTPDRKQAVNVTALDGSNIEPRNRRDGSRDGGRRSGFRGNGNGAVYRTVDSMKCYNCGGVGHLSRDCSSKPVVRVGGNGAGCYTCGGVGHMARDCTRVTSVGGGRGCYNCGNEGHMVKDCPDDTASRGACYTCKEVGHMARDCPSGNDAGFDDRGCYTCKEVGHMSRDCPSGTRRVNDAGFDDRGCYTCGEKGHIAKDCENAGDGRGSSRSGRAAGYKSGGGCYNCGKEGHFARDCPSPSK